MIQPKDEGRQADDHAGSERDVGGRKAGMTQKGWDRAEEQNRNCGRPRSQRSQDEAEQGNTGSQKKREVGNSSQRKHSEVGCAGAKNAGGLGPGIWIVRSQSRAVEIRPEGGSTPRRRRVQWLELVPASLKPLEATGDMGRFIPGLVEDRV